MKIATKNHMSSPTAVTPAETTSQPGRRRRAGPGPGTGTQRARDGRPAAADGVSYILRTEVHTAAPGPNGCARLRSSRRSTVVAGGFRVPQAARRQPGRDRDPGLPRRLRARPGDGRGLPLRGPQLPAPREGRRVVPDRRARPPGAGLPVGRRGHRCGAACGCGRRLSRLRVPLGESAAGGGLRRRRDHLHRATRPRAAPDRRQGPRHRRGPGGRPAGAGVVGSDGGDRRARRGRGRRGLPAVRQGRRRGRRPRHAPRRRPGQLRESAARRHARGPGGVRRPDDVPGARGRQPSTHRGADPRRLRGERRAPLRARLLAAAAPPEGHRDRPGAEPGPADPRPDLRGRRRVRPAHRLRQRRDGGVPARRARRARVHRDEPAHPGRAHRHRAGHRPRSGDRPAAGRGRHDAARDGPAAGRHPAPRCRAAVPGHHRGPGQRLPPGHRRDQRLPVAGRPGCPARRGHARRRRGQRVLRLDAGQAHLQQPHLRQRRAAGPAGRRRVPHPGRRDEPAVSGRGARRPRLPGRAGSPRASSTSARTCSTPAGGPTAAPGSSPTSPRRR